MSLRATDLVIRAGRAELLHGTGLEVQPGEVVAVAGPNGAGKTTLLKALAGDVEPGDGEVTLDGRPLRGWPLDRLALRRAVMSQDTSVVFPWRGAEVVMLGRIPHNGGDPDPADHELVARLLDAVDATPLADREMATLSGGERQRIQLARALAQLWSPDDRWLPLVRDDDATSGHGSAPGASDGAAGAAGAAGEAGEAGGGRYLLLDEPTASLDLRHQQLALRLVRRAAADGIGVVVVLHDLNLAAEHADRVALMHHGRVVEAGGPAAVLRQEVLERVFEVPMLVVSDPRLAHPLVVPDPAAGTRPGVTGRSAAPPP